MRAAHPPHAWNLSPEAATALQERLRAQVRRVSFRTLGQIHTVAGVDVAYSRMGEVEQARAAVVVWSLADQVEIERTTATIEVTFPYMPGLLSFREAPAVLAALDRLRTPVDLLLCDGQGYAHPRRFGLACHLGVYLDCPSIGCAKTRLIGTYQAPGTERGACSPLMDGAEEIGMVVRTRAHTKPMYVSVGHQMDLATAVAVVLRCGQGYRQPEPLRVADQLTRHD